MWICSTGIYFNRIVHICAHRRVCSYCLAHTYFASTHTHARTHTHTHIHTHAHTYTRTHTHARILAHKCSSIYIQTVFLFACVMYCKGGKLYSTRVVPLYVCYVFLFFSLCIDFFVCVYVFFFVEYFLYVFCAFVFVLHVFLFFYVKWSSFWWNKINICIIVPSQPPWHRLTVYHIYRHFCTRHLKQLFLRYDCSSRLFLGVSSIVTYFF